jgi:hypothetical protein
MLVHAHTEERVQRATEHIERDQRLRRVIHSRAACCCSGPEAGSVRSGKPFGSISVAGFVDAAELNTVGREELPALSNEGLLAPYVATTPRQPSTSVTSQTNTPAHALDTCPASGWKRGLKVSVRWQFSSSLVNVTCGSRQEALSVSFPQLQEVWVSVNIFLGVLLDTYGRLLLSTKLMNSTEMNRQWLSGSRATWVR